MMFTTFRGAGIEKIVVMKPDTELPASSRIRS